MSKALIVDINLFVFCLDVFADLDLVSVCCCSSGLKQLGNDDFILSALCMPAQLIVNLRMLFNRKTV